MGISLSTLNKRAGTSSALSKGMQYYKAGCVHLQKSERGTLRAAVAKMDGNADRFYAVSVTFNRNGSDIARAHRLQQGEVAGYGKQLPGLKHYIGAFLPEYRPLVQFFIRQYRGREYIKDHMNLTPAALDDFFEAVGELPFLLEEQGHTREVQLGRADIRPQLSLKRQDKGFVMALSSKMTLLEGAAGLYLLHASAIYTCSEDYAVMLRPLLGTLKKAQKNALFIADADMPAFVSSVLRRVEPYIDLYADDALGEFAPPPLVIKIYFDRYGENGAEARMEFSYADKTKPAFAPKRVTQAYDIAGEVRAEQALQRYMGTESDDTGTHFFESDPERLLTLAGRGIAELSEFAEIYASEAFKSVKIRPPLVTAAGVKVEGGLLDFSFEAEGLAPGELAEILGSYRKRQKYHRMRDGSFLALDDSALEQFYALAEGLGLSDQQLAKGRAELSLNQSVYLDESAKRCELLRFERDRQFKRIIRDFREAENADFEVPQELKRILQGYQKTGYRWLRTLDRFCFGGILVDDMGLGKTLQVLAMLLAEKQTGGMLPVSWCVRPRWC